MAPLPVSVPGAVDGWFALHGRFGKLPMQAQCSRRPSATPAKAIRWRDHRVLLGPLGAALSKWPGSPSSSPSTASAPAPRRDLEEPESRRTRWSGSPTAAATPSTVARSPTIDAYFRANEGFLR
jgi:gamma-glutamyltranspeptidase/glutathione hydrolase